MPASSLRSKQEEKILSILNLHCKSSSEEPSSSLKWKILIYDDFCKDILLPVINTKLLRENGITLHLLLSKPRERVEDVAAIYLVEPTRENVEQIAADCEHRLYDAVHLNFSSSLPRELLELLAQQTTQSKSASLVASLHDCYTDFVSLDSQLFTLNLKHSFLAYMERSAEEAQIVQYSRRVAQGLLSAIATSGIVPVIVGPTAECCAKIVSTTLDQMLRETLESTPELFPDSIQARPLLIILDRFDDPTIPLFHSSAYMPLIYDLLPTAHHRVLTGSGTYFMDTKSDEFWRENCYEIFPSAIEHHRAAIQSVSDKESHIRQGSGTEHLTAAMESLPKLLEEKKLLEQHTTLFQLTMDEITKRNIPNFVELEEKLLSGSVSLSEVEEFVKRTSGAEEDKVRLLVIFLSLLKTPLEDAKRCLPLLSSESQRLLSLFLDWRQMQQSSRDPSSSGGGGGGGAGGSSGEEGDFWKKATGFLAKATAQVRNYLPQSNQFYTTQIVEALVRRQTTGLVEGYCYYDPKMKGKRGVAQHMQDTLFDSVMVFMVGGGSVVEYLNMRTKLQGNKAKLTYGATQLFTPKEYMEELTALSLHS